MSLAAFTWTTRARPIVELGVGDLHAGGGLAQWDSARWDDPAALWAGSEPAWLDISCDVQTVRFEYGRQRTTDRFVVGQASIVVDNTSGWADPNAVEEPGVLTVRPGRGIRVSVDHVNYGRRVLFRGFVDAMTPVYVPTSGDTVELSCIDVLGEVNRAKLVPVDPPIGDGEAAADRVVRILDAASWPTDARDIGGSGETLVATDLGGQVADLLGRTADSAGGNVWGALDGRVTFRGRDWQTFPPGTPVDATIGNVEPGHTIPGVPQVDGYLNLAGGNVSTVDSPNMGLDGKFRLTVRARLVTLPASGFPLLLGKTGTGTANRELMIYITAPSGGMSFSTARVGLATNTDGTVKAPPLPLGEDHTYGFEATPGLTAYTAIFDAVRTNGTLTSVPAFPDSTAPVAVGQIVAGFTGRIYWAQMEAINRARLVFPGVAGNYLSVPDAANLQPTGDLELVARLTPTSWTPAANNAIVARWADPASYGFLFRLQTSAGLLLNVRVGGVNVSAASTVPVTPSGTRWVKVTRVAATGVVQFFTAPDSPTEPTTWTKLGADVATAVGALTPAGATPVMVGAFNPSGATQPFAGRIARVIVRNAIGSTSPVLDVSENNAGTMATGTTFVATTGQTVTVVQTAGNTIVQPQAGVVVWRFDANDYPGTGTSYVDPRGRTWTLSAAGAIVPKVPAVPNVIVPPDVCPVGWERPFARADIATRAIMGRDLASAVVVDDTAGQRLYGIEPFERTDLLTKRDDSLTMLAERVLRVRAADTAPRVRSVSLDARTADNVLDLMTSVEVYRPSRYRCRLQYPDPRGLVFDADYMATGIAHEMTPTYWSAELNLDLAAPFEAAGGKWDDASWDLAVWQ